MTTKYLIWGYNPKEKALKKVYARCDTDIELQRTISELINETRIYPKFAVQDNSGRVVIIAETIKPIGARK